MACLDVVTIDGGDLGNPGVDQGWIAVQRRVLTQRISARVDARQLMQPMALELGFGSSQLVLGWSVGDQLIDQLDDFLLKLLGADAVSSPRIAEAERVATNQAHRGCSGALGVLGTTDQLLVQPRRLTVPEDAEGEVECIEIPAAARG